MANVRTRRSPRKQDVAVLDNLNDRAKTKMTEARTLRRSDAESDDEFLDLETLLGLPKRRNDSPEKEISRRPSVSRQASRRKFTPPATEIGDRSESVTEKNRPVQMNSLFSTSFTPSLKPTVSIPLALKAPGKARSLDQNTTDVIGRSSQQAQRSRSPMKKGTAVLVKKTGTAKPREDIASPDEILGRLDLGSTRTDMLEQGRNLQQKTSDARRGLISSGRGHTRSRPGQDRADPFASKLVLREANCNDDDSADEEGSEDEETDLSGFIVDDEIDPDFESGAASDQDSSPVIMPKRRVLVRGSKGRNERCQDSGDQVPTEDSLADAFGNITLTHGHSKSVYQDASRDLKTIEVIDLTESPSKVPRATSDWPLDGGRRNDRAPGKVKVQSEKEVGPLHSKRVIPVDSADDLSDHKNAIIRFSPPSRRSPLRVRKEPLSTFPAAEQNKIQPERPSTPPLTPPGSPTKLRSPTKLNSPKKNPLLLSPSKDKNSRAIPKSPHRPSIDAFWSSEVINDWNDQYSPAKPTLTISPRKRWKIWEDDDASSSSGTESPSESPARRAPKNSPSLTKLPSTSTAPSSPTKKSLAADRKAVKATKAAFESTKASLATTFLAQLDTAITNGQLATLSASTGGVQIVWSKTLRSTAGRANWRRTVVTAKPRPNTTATADSNPTTTTTNARSVETKHFASIELATKVIDNPQRLTNTLAHEFCHLANFMVSGVRGEPHGKSWRAWAAKTEAVFGVGKEGVDGRFCGVQVSTKHAYEIEYKYLWVCAGESPGGQGTRGNGEVRVGDEGCGTEYGRHSKSIDPAMDQCGKCRGFLTQVRPKPRRQGLKKGVVGKGVGMEELEKKLGAIVID